MCGGVEGESMGEVKQKSYFLGGLGMNEVRVEKTAPARRTKKTKKSPKNPKNIGWVTSSCLCMHALLSLTSARSSSTLAARTHASAAALRDLAACLYVSVAHA